MISRQRFRLSNWLVEKRRVRGVAGTPAGPYWDTRSIRGYPVRRVYSRKACFRLKHHQTVMAMD